jgi:FecR protein
MSDEKELKKGNYLWDGSGEPDGEIVRLERVLGRFRHAGTAPEWPAAEGVEVRRPRARFGRGWLWFGLAAVGASAVVIFSLWFALRRPLNGVPTASAGWGVENLAGTPRVGRKAIGKTGGTATLRIGQTLETDSESRASIAVSDVGRVEIEPETRLRLVESAASRTRLSLERGTIHAMIWAPAGEFAVDTPSAIAVDLGCAYTLIVDARGAGVLRTTLGWVGFKLNGREAFIPSGAVGATRPVIGPGTPYYEDAPEALRAALAKFDFEKLSAEERSAELTIVLAEARKQDALTLWHLLSRTEGVERERVFDRLKTLAPPPAEVTRAGVMGLDQKMIDAWWNDLGFGDISLWRSWERTWMPRERD